MLCCVHVSRILKRMFTQYITFSERYLCVLYSMLPITSYFMRIKRKRERNIIWNKMKFWIKTKYTHVFIFFNNIFITGFCWLVPKREWFRSQGQTKSVVVLKKKKKKKKLLLLLLLLLLLIIIIILFLLILLLLLLLLLNVYRHGFSHRVLKMYYKVIFQSSSWKCE